ncbi:hypothetical protein [Lysobacter sp. yr284]|uniref:hypothetical protein n=1 Tax=Lysobacter sp. yr284 TaxID=1761791 RepID=UPI0015872419|nr:hypothetical protein [Lysobacter sp. yr284]
MTSSRMDVVWGLDCWARLECWASGSGGTAVPAAVSVLAVAVLALELPGAGVWRALFGSFVVLVGLGALGVALGSGLGWRVRLRLLWAWPVLLGCWRSLFSLCLVYVLLSLRLFALRVAWCGLSALVLLAVLLVCGMVQRWIALSVALLFCSRWLRWLALASGFAAASVMVVSLFCVVVLGSGACWLGGWLGSLSVYAGGVVAGCAVLSALLYGRGAPSVGDAALVWWGWVRLAALSGGSWGCFGLLLGLCRWTRGVGALLWWVLLCLPLAQFCGLLLGGCSSLRSASGGLWAVSGWRWVLVLSAGISALARGAVALLAAVLQAALYRAVLVAAGVWLAVGFVLVPGVAPLLLSVVSASRCVSRLVWWLLALETGSSSACSWRPWAADLDLFGWVPLVGTGFSVVAWFGLMLLGWVGWDRSLPLSVLACCPVRAALVVGVVLRAGLSRSSSSVLRLRLRWLRGCWPLVAWLVSSVRGAAGARVCRLLLRFWRW